MVDHQEVFKRLKDLLARHTTIKVDELDYGTHLTIDQTEIWVETDAIYFTIGYGFSHIHCDPKHGNLRDAIEQLFNLLTKRKRITTYFKGDKSFKQRIEIELQEDKFEHFGTTMTWWFPFWRRTKKEIQFQHPLLEFNKVQSEIGEIYKLV